MRVHYAAILLGLAISFGNAHAAATGLALTATPLADATPKETAGWKQSAWFGAFNDQRWPWIYHRDHGWLLVSAESTSGTLHFRDLVMGNVYTDQTVYPQVYSFERNTWLLYQKNTAAPRRFYDYSPETCLDYEIEVESIDRTPNGFRFTHATIPISEIFAGGPARDGIPAILDPKFVSLATADADYMEDPDLLLSFTVNGKTRAYPYRILNWHEICNDKIDEVCFAVTYCPLCGTGVVFDRLINGQERTFGVSGMLYLDNVLMYDHQSESLWSQLLLKSVTGSQFRTRLEWLEGEVMNWAAWKERFPNGEVLSTDTGHNRNYDRNPYQGYEDIPDILRPVGEIRDDLAIKDWVYGILINDKAMAIPRDQMPEGVPVTFTFEGASLVATYDQTTNNITVHHVDTGAAVVGIWSFWFSWQAFYRDTEVLNPTDP